MIKDFGKVHRIIMSGPDLSVLWADNYVDEEKYFGRKLITNEYFAVMNNEDKSGKIRPAIFRRTRDGYRRAEQTRLDGESWRKITPGKKGDNVEQMCFIDAYMDPEIDLIFLMGDAGTGKSYIISACGIWTAENTKGKTKFLFTREIVEAGKPMGFLPGEVEDKTDPYWAPARKTIAKIQNTRGYHARQTFEFGLVQFVPLQFMRGESIDNTIMYNDEAQNEDLETVQMFATRKGEGSKVIFSGSDKQVDEKSLRDGNNGLTLLKHIMAGEPNVVAITLVQQERSNLAQQIDKRVALWKERGFDGLEAQSEQSHLHLRAPQGEPAPGN